MTVIGALGSPSTPSVSGMPATSLAAPLLVSRVSVAPPEAETAIGDDEDDGGDAGHPAEGERAAAAGVGRGLGTLDGLAGGLALGAQLALGLGHGYSVRLIVGSRAGGAPGVGWRTYASAGGARSRVKRAKRRSEGSAAGARPWRTSSTSAVRPRGARAQRADQLAGGRYGLQREREHAAGERAEGEHLQPAAAEDGAAAELGDEHRLAAARGPQAGGGDDPQRRRAPAPACEAGDEDADRAPCRPAITSSAAVPEAALAGALEAALRARGTDERDTRLVHDRREQRHQHQRAQRQRHPGEQGAQVHPLMIGTGVARDLKIVLMSPKVVWTTYGAARDEHGTDARPVDRRRPERLSRALRRRPRRTSRGPDVLRAGRAAAWP